MDPGATLVIIERRLGSGRLRNTQTSERHSPMTSTAVCTPITVMEATTAPPDGTTRYIDQIVTFSSSQTRFVYFSWARALRAQYDVLHIHWPERLLRGSSLVKRSVAPFLVGFLLLVLRARKIPIVRTLHNVSPHEAGSALERLALRALDRATTLFVTINPVTRAPHGVGAYIPHGHYRDRFSAHPKSVPQAGLLVYAGLIRPYKGIERLIECFEALPEQTDARLRIVGKPTAELKSEVEAASARDSKITAKLAFVPDNDLVAELTAAELVCLPYDELHNSGMALVALSLDRPLLVPDTETTRALADEVGPGWLHLFTGTLTPDKLATAIEQNRAAAKSRPDRPVLGDRTWQLVGTRYEAVFRTALVQK